MFAMGDVLEPRSEERLSMALNPCVSQVSYNKWLPLTLISMAYLLNKLVTCPIEFSIPWILLNTSSWCHLTVSSVPVIPIIR